MRSSGSSRLSYALASELTIWLIILLPAFAFVLNGIVLRWIPEVTAGHYRLTGKKSDLAGWLTAAAVGASFVLSLLALIKVVSDGAQQVRDAQLDRGRQCRYYLRHHARSV